MKKLNRGITKFQVLLIAVVLLVGGVSAFYYLQKPDLAIINVVAENDQNPNICKYNIEIQNKGFAAINQPANNTIGYCFWTEGQEKCRSPWDVITRDPSTGQTQALFLAPGEKYKFETVEMPKSFYGGTCPNILHFCVDCGLHVVYEKEIVGGFVPELREGNNEYTYIAK